MIKRTPKSTKVSQGKETDGAYFLKLVLYLIIGAQWIRLTNPGSTTQIPLPAGLIVGGIFAMHEHFQIDRKIEYAVLLIAALIGFWAEIGVFVYVLK